MLAAGRLLPVSDFKRDLRGDYYFIEPFYREIDFDANFGGDDFSFGIWCVVQLFNRVGDRFAGLIEGAAGGQARLR
jgi:hypothetical protein